MYYYEYIQSEDWNRKRRERLAIDGYKCVVCGRSDVPLQVHHRSYDHLGDEQMDELITVCETCHGIITDIEHYLHDHPVSHFKYLCKVLARDDDSISNMLSNNAVIQAFSNHADSMSLDNASQEAVSWLIENVMEAVRDEYQPRIRHANRPKNLAKHLKDGTRRLGKTIRENADAYSAHTTELIARNLTPLKEAIADVEQYD